MACRDDGGYTSGMKTAVSVPDEIFARAEELARRTRRSRSRLYAEALAEYLDRHDPDRVTAAMNAVCDDLGAGIEPFVEAAAHRTLEQVEW